MRLCNGDHLRITLNHRQRVIDRAVVDHNDLAIEVGLREGACYRVIEEAPVVVVGDKDANPQGNLLIRR
jgi:hypothetical protein